MQRMVFKITPVDGSPILKKRCEFHDIYSSFLAYEPRKIRIETSSQLRETKEIDLVKRNSFLKKIAILIIFFDFVDE